MSTSAPIPEATVSTSSHPQTSRTGGKRPPAFRTWPHGATMVSISPVNTPSCPRSCRLPEARQTCFLFWVCRLPSAVRLRLTKFADQFSSGDSAIGKHITVARSDKPESYEIIGVVGDTPYQVTQPLKATMYFPILSGIPNRTSAATIVVRAAEDPLLLSIPIQQQVAALDPSLPVYDVLTMQQILGQSTASQSFSATLVLAFAVLSLLLAAIGL